ncbi:MAG: hypothetical protein ABSC06_07380 [Rhodopila sp.]
MGMRTFGISEVSFNHGVAGCDCIVLRSGTVERSGRSGRFGNGRICAGDPVNSGRGSASAILCSFRLTKILLDAGLPWEAANPIVSNDSVWQSHHHDDPGCRYLAIFHRGSEWTLYSCETLAADLDSATIKSDWMTLVDLRELRQNVVFRNRAAALKAVAEDVASTSHFSAKSGAALLTPSEAAGRQRDIETCAEEIGKLAALAEQGSGSYQQFEVILTGLHKMGKFPDASAVSAVAAAFVD